MGGIRFQLDRNGDDLKIVTKRVMFNVDVLIPQGEASICL